MFHCRSVNHHHAPLAVREWLSLSAEQQSEWLARHAADEVVVLSTCNRLELYAHVDHAQQMNALWANLLQMRDVTPIEVAAHTLSLNGQEVARHLFRVACGLDSMALGEPQILGQVTRAYEQAETHGAAGAALSLLFRAAIHAAKRARTQTAIGKGAASVGSLAIARAEEVLGALSERTALVIGAGEMGQTIVKGLAQRGAQRVTLVSRTLERARRLAAEWNITARPITALKEALLEADVIFTTAGAGHVILSREDIAPIMAARGSKSLCIVDIAIPRNVAPDVGDIEGVCLHDLDMLQHVVERNLAERQASVPTVEHLLEEELDAFWRDYRAREVVPTIRLLRERAEALRQAELARVFNRLPPESARERELFEQFSHRLMNKMLHHVTRSLRERAAQDDGELFAHVARDLFGLEERVR